MRLVTALLASLFLLMGAFAPAEPAFRKALPGYQFTFPRDHAAHPDFRTEWWYFTGNLSTPEGREFGFKFTIFRNSLAPRAAWVDSPLAANEVLLGHFAISDLTNREHAAWERIGRPGFGQAAASTETLDTHIGDWRIRMDDAGRLHVTTTTGDAGVDLVLTAAKPFVIHGEDGAHQKAPERGAASHYISFTRLDTEGTLTWRGETHQVTGQSWMDQEFGSNQLGDDEVGWDWFALQLETGEDLMVYNLRRRDGTYNPFSRGSLILADGTRHTIPGEQYTIQHTDTWTSPESGATYPMGWRIELPQYDAEIIVTPVFPEQEMRMEDYTGTTYWEGAIRVSGTWRGQPVAGKGYVELVGYKRDFDLL